MYIHRLILGFCFIAVVSNAQAVKVEGTFTAVKSCPAYQSFTKGHNPGDIHIVPGRTYEVVEENKPDGPWALVLVPEISDSRRWVAKECGVTKIATRPADAAGAQSCKIPNTYDSNVLALSWQAGFCEHFDYSGVKQECDNLNAGRISVTNITIHGLWPNKSGCGKNYGNCSIVQLELEEETVIKIAPWMPNWYYSTDFGTHEWNKHGTCQKLSDDDYFILMQRLAEKFDSSPMGEYMRENMGSSVRVAEMESYLSTKLGEDVTKKIELRCTGSGRRYVNEFWINLPAEVNASGTLAELVTGAKNKTRFRGNCAEEIYIEVPGPD
jgi:ribonuclease T2